MPWHLPDELRHFKSVTLGKPVIMGRKTREAIGLALPGRQNIVVSRNPEFSVSGCDTAISLEQAIETASGPEVMIIGGGELYRQAMPLAGRMFLTIIDCEPEADTWFPERDEKQWQEVGRTSFPADDQNPHSFSIVEYLRVPVA